MFDQRLATTAPARLAEDLDRPVASRQTPTIQELSRCAQEPLNPKFTTISDALGRENQCSPVLFLPTTFGSALASHILGFTFDPLGRWNEFDVYPAIVQLYGGHVDPGIFKFKLASFGSQATLTHISLKLCLLLEIFLTGDLVSLVHFL
ncbi:hypothetical protein KCU65_g453, partial [Aureobasidium melanogenum]